MDERHYTAVCESETCELLKEAGFHEKTHDAYNVAGGLLHDDFPADWNNGTDKYVRLSAPTYAQVIDWLITKGLSINMYILRSDKSINYKSCVTDNRKTGRTETSFPYERSWRKSADEAIKLAIRILKQDN